MKTFFYAHKWFYSALWSAFILFFFIPTWVCALEITLEWDEIMEPVPISYKVYYKKVSPGPPYNGTGLSYGGKTVDSPIDVGNATRITLSNLTPEDVYFFVVTAYLSETPSLESSYSNEVSTLRISYPSSGFYVDPTSSQFFTIKGNYRTGTIVEIFAGEKSLGTTQADENGEWIKAVDFSSISDGPITLTAQADGSMSPGVTGILDKKTILGDVNGDGVVDSGDAILVLRYSVGLIALSESAKWAANVTGKASSENIDAGDAVRILSYCVGMQSVLLAVNDKEGQNESL